MRLKGEVLAIAIAVALAFAALSPAIAFAGLIGSDVTAVELFPNQTSICNVTPFCSGPIGPVPVTSGAPPEFPAGTLAFDGSVAVTDTQIIWTATLTELYDSAAFNGFNLMFTGAPPIINVTVDPASTMLPVAFTGFPVSSSSGFSFNASNVLFNLSGDNATAGQKLILDVQTSPSATPEPGGWLLLATGIAGLLLLYRRRQRAA